jgi:hypothetical protein
MHIVTGEEKKCAFLWMSFRRGGRIARIAPWRELLRRYIKADGFGLGKGEHERFA